MAGFRFLFSGNCRFNKICGIKEICVQADELLKLCNLADIGSESLSASWQHVGLFMNFNYHCIPDQQEKSAN